MLGMRGVGQKTPWPDAGYRKNKPLFTQSRPPASAHPLPPCARWCPRLGAAHPPHAARLAQALPSPPPSQSPFPRPSPQGTPEALPYPLLRRLPRTRQSHAAPGSGALWRGSRGTRSAPQEPWARRGRWQGGWGACCRCQRKMPCILPIRPTTPLTPLLSQCYSFSREHLRLPRRFAMAQRIIELDDFPEPIARG
jgi:hypothetical protein